MHETSLVNRPQITRVTMEDVGQAAREHGLSGHAPGIHSSFRSFGWVDGGAQTVIDGFLAEGCTVVVPTFNSFGRPPPDGRGPARNGFDYESLACSIGREEGVCFPGSAEISKSMGAIPRTNVRMEGRVRGNHPLCSFAGVESRAAELIHTQKPFQVFAPLEAMAAADGFYVLIGVGLDKMTAIHLAEQKAGLNLFRRWANGPADDIIEAEVGGCSAGFEKLAPAVASLEVEARVNQSKWRIYPARAFLEAMASAIRNDPASTHCGRPDCEECDDAIQGGPILND